jgi:serine/threonine protein phosphatase PrpC
MQITHQRPKIQDIPAFLLAMAEALEKMHAEQQAHGAIVEGALKDWLNDAEDALDEGRFRAAAKTADQLPDDSLRADVHSFATYCIGVIAGTSAVAGESFKAMHHLGKVWPPVFLQLLESLTKQGAPSVSIGDLSRAMKVPVVLDSNPEPETIESAGGFSAPAVTEPASAAPPEIEPAVTEPVSAAPPEIEPATVVPAIRIALRNATVGKPYSYEPGVIAGAMAKQFGNDPANARISQLLLPEDCGLVFDKVTGSISGTPTIAFDREFTLEYVPSLNAPRITAKVTLLINPDPASLWKDLPPEADAPYQKPLLAQSEERHGPFRIVAASRRGRSHAQKGEFRDDDYAIGYAAETGWLVIVVADGAGSASYSRRGSQIACEVAKNQLMGVLNSAQYNQAEALYLQHLDWQHPEVKNAMRQSLYEAALLAHHKLRAEVAQPSEVLSPPPTLRNYDTTLILLVMKKVGEGCIAATFAIGDGGAGILAHPSEGIPLTKADSGEHAGQTIFLTFDSTVSNTEANLESRFHFAQTQEFAGALAMTDGITDPKFPSDAAFADPAQWAALWAELQPSLTSSQALLDWMNFFSPGNHDDRTLVAVLPAPPAAPDSL